jgi:DnaJ-class molecular chaperone
MGLGKKEYYGILEVSREASENEIKRSYRRLALQFHPDRTHGDTETEERFKEISEAYAVLSDPAKRRHYDATGSDDYGNPLWAGTASQRGFRGSSHCCGRGMGLGHLFSRGGMSRRAYRHVYRLPLTTIEARQGTQKDITFNFNGVLQRVHLRTPAGLRDGSVLFVGVGDRGISRHEIIFRVSLKK